MDIRDKRILLVEDQPHLVDHVCEGLRAHGAVVLGPAPTAFYATQLLAGRGIDVAILDLWLYGEPVFDLADMLAERGTPFILATDGEADAVPQRHAARPRTTKPYEFSQLLGLISALGQESLPASFSQKPDQRLNEDVEASLEGGTSGHSRLNRAITVVMRRNADPAR